jgi:hypothetical protein
MVSKKLYDLQLYLDDGDEPEFEFYGLKGLSLTLGVVPVPQNHGTLLEVLRY